MKLYRCKTCDAVWEMCTRKICGGGVMGMHWHLRSRTAGACCDNAPMELQLEPLQ